MRPPAGVNFTALDSRLSAICLSARRSARSCRSGDIRAVTSSCLSCGARGDHAHGFGEQRVEVEVLEIEADAAGFDLRHVEDVVDDLEQILPAAADVAAIFVIFLRAERAEHAGFHDFGEADDGVERRAQLVAHIGEEFRLRLVGLFGACLFGGVFFAPAPPSAAAKRAGRRRSPSGAFRCRSASLRAS